MIRRSDYRPPAWWVNTVDLDVDIAQPWVVVRARLVLRRNPAVPPAPLVLDGAHHELLGIAIEGRSLPASAYRIDGETLTIPDTPEAFTLETRVRFDPWQNTRLEGFFASGTGLFSQCEAEGFRAITWFPDRPDVMASYRVTLHADKAAFPQLLANGNLVAQGDEAAGRHWRTWEDPFPKPSYLFAMVAARLDVLEGQFVTRSGKQALLQVYVDPSRRDEAAFAMDCLKRSMRWDERRFGLELDLDRFMIVAVADFNMGAMENKGLNIFNAKYVLARPDTATDTDYQLIDRIVAHEYFHNWTGNRVTCRDWFQLSLKEGLTVYRDQEYGADEYSRAVTRIQDVRDLRDTQFPEDAGPMAHPVRPEAYAEINNFYTSTVYEKGAEVVRMYATLLGTEGFRRGMSLYFSRHDGQAVTCDDFRAAMSDANGADLAQFERWYQQAGTPRVSSRGVYDAESQRYVLTLGQSGRPQPDGTAPSPWLIPVAVGLVGPDGQDMPLKLSGGGTAAGVASVVTGAPMNASHGSDRTRVLVLRDTDATFIFEGVSAKPVPSLLRGFSAPVIVEHDYADEELLHLFAHDSDAFNRWEAGQRLATRVLSGSVLSITRGGPPDAAPAFIEVIGRLLANGDADPAFVAECLSLPSEAFLAEQFPEPDPEAIHRAREALKAQVAAAHRALLEETVHRMDVPGPYSPDAAAAGKRSLRAAALSLLMSLGDTAARSLALGVYTEARNMTDRMAALACLAAASGAEREQALGDFYARWYQDAIVLDKWFRVQATSPSQGGVDRVRALASHADFDLRHPNRARSVLHAFANDNPVHFHARDGAGYEFIAGKVVELDRINPQVAARLARSFDRWRRYDAVRRTHAEAALKAIASTVGLSPDVSEIVGKALS